MIGPTNPLKQLSATCRAAFVACAFVAAIIDAATWRITRAVEADTSNLTPPPIAYRRIFVPANNLEAWPRDGEKYIPVESRDFDTWVAAANHSTRGQLSSATIDAAEYTATLENDGRFHGRGKWTISLRGDKPVILPLGPLSLAIHEPRWQGETARAARLGAWGVADRAAGQFGLEVPRSGVLEFSWTTASPTKHNELEIPWRTPTAAAMRLTLDLPDGNEPTIEGAAVLESSPLSGGDAAEEKPRRRWVLAVSPSAEAILRIATNNRDTVPSNSVDQLTLSDVTSYRVEQRGLETTATWDLEGFTNQQRELSVLLPRGAQITSIAEDRHELAWRIIHGPTPSPDRAVISLPVAADHNLRHVIVSAWYPLTLDRPWQLPTLRPDGVFWSSGKFELTVAPEFELQNLTPTDCAQGSSELADSKTGGAETHSLVACSSAAALEVSVSRRRPEATIHAGSSLVLADQDLTGRLVTEWDVTRSSLHRLRGDLAAGWNVETIETIPADAMAEWFIDRRDNRRELEIQLTDAASPTRKVSVIVMGRLQRFSLAQPILVDTLRMVTWSDAHIERHLLSFQSSEPFAIDSVGKLPVLPRDATTDADRSLLDGTAGDGRVVDLTHAAPEDGVQLSLKRGTYTAEVEVEAIYAGNELRQLYRITARPQSNAVDRLLVYATSRLGNSARWTDKSGELPLLSERLSADAWPLKDLPKEGELWLLRLPQPTTEPIEIAATVTSAWPKRDSVPLIALPEAAEQHGRVLMRSNTDVTPAVDAPGLTAVPLPSTEHASTRPDDALPVRAAFRFNPADCVRLSNAPRFLIGPGGRSGTNSLVANNVNLESFYWPDGRGAHRATFQLESIGASEFNPPLSRGAIVTSVLVNGQSLNASLSSTDRTPAPIRLPLQSHSVIVAVCFDTQEQPLSTGRAIELPLHQNGTPLLAGEWKMWLPEEFAADAADPLQAPRYNWRQRLFGPFGRSSDSKPFHPLQPADWANLVDDFTNWLPAFSPASARANSDERVSIDDGASTPPVASRPIPIRSDRAGSKASPDQESKQSTSDILLPGWHAYREAFVADSTLKPLVILHPPATTSWSVAILIAMFLLGRLLCRQPGVYLIATIAVAAGMALLLPPAFAPLATGALWGLLLSNLAGWPRQLFNTDQRYNGGYKRTAISSVIALTAAWSAARSGFAQPPANSQPADATVSSSIERVLIPVDASRHPSGSKYYVSERFLRELLASSSPDSAQAESQWLLLDAAYAAELTEDRDRADVVSGTWSLAFSIETLARDTTIVLPLVHDEAAWQPTAMLDGVPAPLRWRDPARGCSVEIEQPGRYLLTIICVPKTANVNGHNRLSLTIPPLLSAGFQLHAPTSLTGITVANAKLVSADKGASGTLSGELAQADHIDVEWPRLEPKSGVNQGLTITAMSWLHVAPTATELETKYIVAGGARRPEALTISYDDRWKLEADTKTVITDQSVERPAGRHVVRIPLSAGGADRQEVLLRWKLAGVPVAGNFRLPPIELTSISPTQQWFAMSVDPSLECTVVDNATTGGTSNEFLAKWGNAIDHSTPQVVLANFDPNRIWTLGIRPRQTDCTVHEVLHAAIGLDRVRILYQASVSPGSQNKFQYHVTVPANFALEEVILNAENRTIPTRWTRDSENHVNIFFSEGATSEYRLSLSGSVPISVSEPNPLPRVVSLSTGSAAQQLQLYRDDDVHVALQGMPPAEAAKTGLADLPPVQWLVRPLGTYQLSETAASSARIEIKPEQPTTKGDSLIWLARDSGSWYATFHCRLTADSGDLDTLRFRVPSAWNGPFEIESNVPATTETIPLDEHHQNLVIRFATTIARGSRVDLRIRSPLSQPAGSPVSVPEIVLEPLANGHRYVLVPTSFDSHKMVWTDSGVGETQVPKNLMPASVDLANQRQLEITGEPFQVAVNTQSTTQSTPRVRLADVFISVGERGNQLAFTRLIVSSDGLAECTLQLPADQQLISVTLDGRPALTSTVDATHWRVGLGAAQLPQSLEIVSRSSNGDAGAHVSDLCRPTLLSGDKAIPVELSLWSFARINDSSPSRIEGAAPVSAIDQAALRVDRLVSIAESAAATATEAPEPDGTNWLRPWIALLSGVRDQTQQLVARPAATRPTAQVVRTSEEQISRASKRLDQWLGQVNNLVPQSDAASTGKSSAADHLNFPAWLPADANASYYVAEGGADRLAIKSIESVTTPGEIQLLGLLTIASLSAVAIWLIRTPAARDFLCRWPHILGILLGIAWWAWLWPSWFGLIIVAFSLWHSLRFEWPGRSLRAEASTVLRSTRSH